MKKLLVTMLVSAATMSAAAGNLPLPAVPLDNFTSTTPDTMREMKVTIATDDSSSSLVHVGDVALCSRTNCYRQKVERIVAASGTGEGKTSVILDAAIPAGEEILSLYFDSVGRNGLCGDIKLDAPAVLDKELHGEEIMVLVAPPGRKIGSMHPVASASLPYSAGWQTIYYDPTTETTASLQRAVGELTIPAHATQRPTIFSVLVNDVGEDYPAINIYPPVTFLKAASLAVKPLAHERFSAAGEPPAGIELALPGEEHIVSRRAGSDGTLRVDIWKTGQVSYKSGSVQKMRTETDGGVEGRAAPAATANCLQLLSDSADQQQMYKALQSYAVFYLNWCTDIAPHVWIAMVNLNDYRVQYRVKESEHVPFGHYNLALKPLTYFASPGYGVAAINGFMWAGDSGTSVDQIGEALGYMSSVGNIYGNNAAGGGVGPLDGPSGGNKLVLGNGGTNTSFAFFEMSNVGQTFPPYTDYVVSSSTSVEKWGACSMDTVGSRWSAIGVQLRNPSGIPTLVMMSSTSDGTTSAAELCPLFKALNIVDAIRLDGGPSAAMSVSGYLLNPLTGLYWAKYGQLRNIAYAITM